MPRTSGCGGIDKKRPPADRTAGFRHDRWSTRPTSSRRTGGTARRSLRTREEVGQALCAVARVCTRDSWTTAPCCGGGRGTGERFQWQARTAQRAGARKHVAKWRRASAIRARMSTARRPRCVNLPGPEPLEDPRQPVKDARIKHTEWSGRPVLRRVLRPRQKKQPRKRLARDRPRSLAYGANAAPRQSRRLWQGFRARTSRPRHRSALAVSLDRKGAKSRFTHSRVLGESRSRAR